MFLSRRMGERERERISLLLEVRWRGDIEARRGHKRLNIFTCMRFLFPRCDWPSSFVSSFYFFFFFFLFLQRSRDEARRGCFHPAEGEGEQTMPASQTFVDLRLDRRDFEAISHFDVCVCEYIFFSLFTSPFTSR